MPFQTDECLCELDRDVESMYNRHHCHLTFRTSDELGMLSKRTRSHEFATILACRMIGTGHKNNLCYRHISIGTLNGRARHRAPTISTTKSDWVIQVVALALDFFFFFCYRPAHRFVSLWTISFPERNTLHAHTQLVIVHSMCNALLQPFFFVYSCCSPPLSLIWSRVM